MSKQYTPKSTTTPPASDAKLAVQARDRQQVWKEVKDKAIDALAAGETVTTAAQLAGVRRETLSRWIHGNPVFIAKLNEKKNERRHEAIDCISSIVGQTAAALKVALSHPDINPTAVVQSVMSMLPKMYAALLEQRDLVACVI